MSRSYYQANSSTCALDPTASYVLADIIPAVFFFLSCIIKFPSLQFTIIYHWWFTISMKTCIFFPLKKPQHLSPHPLQLLSFSPVPLPIKTPWKTVHACHLQLLSSQSLLNLLVGLSSLQVNYLALFLSDLLPAFCTVDRSLLFESHSLFGLWFLVSYATLTSLVMFFNLLDLNIICMLIISKVLNRHLKLNMFQTELLILLPNLLLLKSSLSYS